MRLPRLSLLHRQRPQRPQPSLSRRHVRDFLLSFQLVALAGFAGHAGAFGNGFEIFSLPESARANAVIEEDGPQLRAQLLLSSPLDQTHSNRFPKESTPRRHVGVLIDLAPGWHIYWRNPGGTGIAPSLGLEGAGLTVGEVNWPAPETFREADGLFTTYGYENRVLLFAPVEESSKNQSTATAAILDSRTIQANASVLICRTQCVPASFSLSAPIELQLPDQEQATIDALFQDARERVPVSAESLGLQLEATWAKQNPSEEESARLQIELSGCPQSQDPCPNFVSDLKHAVFLPSSDESFEFSFPEVVQNMAPPHFDRVEMDLTRLEAGAERLQGILRIQVAGEAPQYVSIDLSIHAKSANTAALPPVSTLSIGRWVQMFLLALLGGFILNGMPCVLPVLAIKVVAIADMAEKDPREVRLHALAYTGGVLGSMALLSCVVLGLRAAGQSVGWGFQFQEPLFVAAISALLVAFALNLFGVFEIEFGQGRLADVGQDSGGLTRSAFEGLLAVVLATPCTAPFLGTAVGFAFASSGFGIVAIFLAIGFGLASPFLAVSFSPGLARFIPRSGPWMMKLRSGLGFSLLATVVWLLWVLGQSGGLDAVIAMVGNLLFLAFLLWGFGQVQPIQSAWLGRASAVTIACLAFAGFNLIDFNQIDSEALEADGSIQIEGDWRRYSEDAVAETLAAGQSAFVVFTADWCITCQVNEQTVLGREVVREAFAESGIALFKADWTKRDESIRRKLAEFGRAGVPLYLVYSPDAPDRPQVLSELLSKREVLAALSDQNRANRI